MRISAPGKKDSGIYCFPGHEKAQARKIIYEDGTVVLRSYSTDVIEISPEGWLSVFGLYSATTIKHIGWFMREYGFTYQTAKTLYLGNKKMNIHTGEVIDR